MEGSGYTQVKKLGQGSFGAAWLVKRNKDGEKLVAKEVRLAGLKQAEKDSAKHEISMLRALKHPNITRYVDHFETRTSLFIVMEYANGGDLYTKIKSRRGQLMKESDVLHYFVQICLALGMMHSQHVLHRDLKTQNVFLTQDGVVKLGDFGISTVLRGTYDVKRTVCGTPYYFSPELCQNKAYNNKSDVWALGCILYELTTLNHAFEGSSMKALMARILKGVYPPIHHQYSKDLSGLISSMLQTDPQKRPSIHKILDLAFIKASMEKMRGDFGEAKKDKRSIVDEAEKRKAVQEAQERAIKAKEMQLEKEKKEKERKAQAEIDHQNRLQQIREKMAADMKAQEERMRKHREENDAREAAAAVKRKEWEARVKARAAEEKRCREKMEAQAKQREAEWNANMEAMKRQREQQARQVQQDDDRYYEQKAAGYGSPQQPQQRGVGGVGGYDAEAQAQLFREQRHAAAANRARALQAEQPQQQNQYQPQPRGGSPQDQQQQQPIQVQGQKKQLTDEERAAAQKEAYWQMRREAEANKRRLMDAGPIKMNQGPVKRDSPPQQQHAHTPPPAQRPPVQQQQHTPPTGASPQRAKPTAEELAAAQREAHIQMRKEAEANRRRLQEQAGKPTSSPPSQEPQQAEAKRPAQQWEQPTPEAPRPPIAVMDDEDLDDEDVDGDQAMHDFLNNEAAGNGDGGDEAAADEQAHKHEESRQADYDAVQAALQEGLQGGIGADEDFGDEEDPEQAQNGAVGLPGRFHLDGKTLQLANVTTSDPLSYRIESLRLFLESALGDTNFLKVYRLLDDVGVSNDQAPGDEDAIEHCKKLLPRNHEKFLTLVVQLIVCEDFYNVQQNQ